MRNLREEMNNMLNSASSHTEQTRRMTSDGIPHFSFLTSHFSFLTSHFSFLFFTLILLSACGVPDDRFVLEGRFKNLNQGEFYLFNMDKGVCDTLRVNDGRFIYDVALKDTTTLVLMFPNFSELPIFARPGTEVTVEGDVSHLKETKVEGSPDNEEMTAFRLATNEMTPPEVVQKARQFIEENPQSVISVYLLDRYFIKSLEPDYPDTYKMSSTLLEHQPENISLVQLHKKLKRLRNLHAKGPLPQFSATDTEGRTVSNANLTGKVNIITTWASWSFESQNAMRQLNIMVKEHKGEISVVSISLDASPIEGRMLIRNDSIKWPNICDGKLWDSPVLEQLGLTFVPDNIVTDKYGNILGRSLTTTDLRIKIDKLLH